MINVTLVGTGSVSSHLKRVFAKTSNIRLTKVVSSRGDALRTVVLDEKGIKPHIYIIAISDDAIATVSEQLKESNSLIVHTSGSVSMTALPKEVRRGVFYPLQTFSKGRKVDFQSVPICIEAEEKEDLELLRGLAESISASVHEISSEQRKSLHPAAVFVNNFTNHIYHIANEICQENQVPFDILKPLIAETAEKTSTLSPFDAQTGPARRHDGKTIKKHLEQLNNQSHKEVYQVLTKSITETYGKKL